MGERLIAPIACRGPDSQNTLISGREVCGFMKFRLEHQLPKKLRYAKVYLEAGSASVFFSLDGTSADWRASIGRGRRLAQLTDREYSRLRALVPATETLDDDGRMVVIRNAIGREESWLQPRWTLTHLSCERPEEDQPYGFSR
jgi:hypothetical protein